MKRTLTTLLAVVLVSGLAGCGKDKEKVAYRPAAFGENNQCYYVDHPDEVIALQNAGLCDRGWAPTVMPVYWHQMYWPYYSSPAYYRTYVPTHTRTVYVERQKSWGQQNKTAIATAAKKATYQGSNGKTVTADKIGATKFGGGNRFGDPGTKFGGGSRGQTPVTATKGTVGNTPTTAKSTPATSKPASKPAPPKATPSPKPKSSPAPKAPSSGGSKSYGGGSRGYSGGGRR